MSTADEKIMGLADRYAAAAAFAQSSGMGLHPDVARAALQSAIQALTKDAERYRWLRYGDNDEPLIKRGPVINDFVYLLRMEKLDAAIDAAIKQEQENQP